MRSSNSERFVRDLGTSYDHDRSCSDMLAVGGAENAGVENAGVEKAGAITYGKPSEQKTLKIPGV